MELDEDTAKEICKRLMEFDPEISEILQYGSSVYLPKYAGDIDLLVFTEKRKGDNFDYKGRLEGLNLKVDMVVKEEGESLRQIGPGSRGSESGPLRGWKLS